MAYAFKSVTKDWLDHMIASGIPPGVRANSTSAAGWPAQTAQLFTVGSDIGPQAVPRQPVFLKQVRNRDPSAADDAVTAIFAFDQPGWPWGWVQNGGGGWADNGPSLWPPSIVVSGTIVHTNHLVRLTYDPPTDLVANVGKQFRSDQMCNTLLLRGCHVDTEMHFNGSAFVVGPPE